MKTFLFIALSFFSLFTFADDTVSHATAAAIQDGQYDYTQDLDIAKVVRIITASNAPGECGPVKAQIEYVDSKGVSHRLEYTRLGDDCQNG
jgi:hypothetical protein